MFIIALLSGVIIFLIRIDQELEEEVKANKALLAHHFEEIYSSVENLQTHKDTLISSKASEVKTKIDELKEKLSNKNISDFEKERLRLELVKVKKDFDEYQSNIMFNMIDMIDAKDNEISLLNFKVDRVQRELINCGSTVIAPQTNKKTIVTHNVLSSLNLGVVPMTRKNVQTYKAKNVDYLSCDFTIYGEINSLGFKSVNLEIKDPSGNIISSEKDKVELTSNHVSYQFKPATGYRFKSGKYMVRATNGSEFESIFSFTLSSKL